MIFILSSTIRFSYDSSYKAFRILFYIKNLPQVRDVYHSNLQEKGGRHIQQQKDRGHDSQACEVYHLLFAVGIVLAIVEVGWALLNVLKVGDDVHESFEEEALINTGEVHMSHTIMSL